MWQYGSTCPKMELNFLDEPVGMGSGASAGGKAGSLRCVRASFLRDDQDLRQYEWPQRLHQRYIAALPDYCENFCRAERPFLGEFPYSERLRQAPGDAIEQCWCGERDDHDAAWSHDVEVGQDRLAGPRF